MPAGRRARHELLRTGAAEARVEAIIDYPERLALARELGLASDEDAELLVTRTISAEGRSEVFVNGRLATVAVLAQLLGDALEITSQGEHQALLRPEVQAELLDRHGGLGPLVAEVAAAYARWRACAQELADRRAQAEELARREDQLRFEIEQIDRVDPQPGELESLEVDHARLAHVERLGLDVSAALELLESAGGARESLARAQALVRADLDLDRGLADALGALERAGLEADEASALLERYRAGLDADPAQLARVEERLGELRRLQARYGPTIEAILAYREQAQVEHERVAGGEARNAQLERELAEQHELLDERARKLSEARHTVAQELEDALGTELAAVDLKTARFSVDLVPLTMRATGAVEPPSGPGGREGVVFQLAANPGEAPRRLREAASGGELARLLLALRNVLRGADARRALLFDEIDAGIGGRTARRVGERLRALASHQQILCITHLPQVAALGERHFHVRKQVRGGRTRSRVLTLEGDDRIDEVARMAGGGKLTDAARAHARELLSAS
jgi:DNA repair protein RecN (Recombination protein N)